MELQLTHENDGRLLLVCGGQIGWEDHESFPEKVQKALDNTAQPQVLMNFEAVDFINSMGIGALLKITKFLESRHGALALANISPRLRELFQTVGLDRVIHLADTLDEARAYLDDPA